MLVALIHFMAAAPWLYSNGAGEPDSIAMITDVYQALLKQTYFSENLYMLVGQPLYYGLFFMVPAVRRLELDQLAMVMNLVSLLASAGSTLLVFLLTSHFASRASAWLAALLLISSPTVIEWSTYAHPVSVSIFLLLAGVYAFSQYLNQSPTQPNSWKWRNVQRRVVLALAILLGGLAVGVRADVLVLFHLYPLVAWLHWGGIVNGHSALWRELLISGVAGVLAALTGMAFLWIFTGSSESTAAASPSVLLAMLRKYFNLMPFHDGIFELAFGLGVVGSLVWTAALCAAILRRQWTPLLIALALVAPPLFYAMGNPQPARRFMHAIYATVLGLAILWPSMRGGSRQQFAILLGCIAVAGNHIWLPLLGRQIYRTGYPTEKHSILSRATASLWDHHSENQQYLYDIDKTMSHLRQVAPYDSLFVGAFAHVHFLRASLSRDRQPVETSILYADNGLIVTLVESGSEHYRVAEYFPWLTTSRLPYSEGQIYNFANFPVDKFTSQPVVNLTPPWGPKFTMWHRPIEQIMK